MPVVPRASQTIFVPTKPQPGPNVVLVRNPEFRLFIKMGICEEDERCVRDGVQNECKIAVIANICCPVEIAALSLSDYCGFNFIDFLQKLQIKFSFRGLIF